RIPSNRKDDIRFSAAERHRRKERMGYPWQSQGGNLRASRRHLSGRWRRLLRRGRVSHTLAVLQLGEGALVDGSLEGWRMGPFPNGSRQQEAQGSVLAWRSARGC